MALLLRHWSRSVHGRIATGNYYQVVKYCSNSEHQSLYTAPINMTATRLQPDLKSTNPSTGANDKELLAPREYRFIFPEFLPDKDPSMRHWVREILERKDMLQRRRVIEIPEFYVGSIMSVTATDRNAPGKHNRFVGICIHRGGYGLRATFILRNVIDHQGVEIMYDLYNPTIQKMEVIRLEKRLDDELFYLRDALSEYSTFPFDMTPTIHPEGSPVPVNSIKVKLKPRPWHERWERKNLKGVQDLGLPERFYERARELATPWEKYDLMKEYRRLIPEEEQQEIYAEVHQQQMELNKKHKHGKRRIIPHVVASNKT